MNEPIYTLVKLPETEGLRRLGLAGIDIPVGVEVAADLFDARDQLCVDRVVWALMAFIEDNPEYMTRYAGLLATLAWMAGGALAQAGFAESALDCYRAGLCGVPDHPGLRLRTAMTCQAMGQHEKALKEYRRLLDKHPALIMPAVRMLAARCAADSGQWIEAVELLKPCRIAMMGEDTFWDLLARCESECSPGAAEPVHPQAPPPIPTHRVERAHGVPSREPGAAPMRLSDQIQAYARSMGAETREKNGRIDVEKTVAERRAFLSRQRLNYVASCRVDDRARTVRFREMLTEIKSGLSTGDPDLSTGFGFKKETYRTGAGQPREGSIHEQSMLFGKKYRYDFDFSLVRPEIEALCKAAGYALEFTLDP